MAKTIYAIKFNDKYFWGGSKTLDTNLYTAKFYKTERNAKNQAEWLLSSKNETLDYYKNSGIITNYSIIVCEQDDNSNIKIKTPDTFIYSKLLITQQFKLVAALFKDLKLGDIHIEQYHKNAWPHFVDEHEQFDIIDTFVLKIKSSTSEFEALTFFITTRGALLYNCEFNMTPEWMIEIGRLMSRIETLYLIHKSSYDIREAQIDD